MLSLTTATTGYTANPLIGLVLAVVFAVGCYLLAQRKGRRPVLWAVLGFFFSLIALIVLAVLPSHAGASHSASRS
ncbi:hypothetical protein V3N99_22190 (plasmid) [Dermatophilaceae bacterium Soc4.6]